MVWKNKGNLVGDPGDSFVGNYPANIMANTSITYSNWANAPVVFNSSSHALHTTSGTDITLQVSGVINVEVILRSQSTGFNTADSFMSLNGTSVGYRRHDSLDGASSHKYITMNVPVLANPGDVLNILFRPQGGNATLAGISRVILTRFPERLYVG